MKKIAVTVLAAAAVAIGVAGPASATFVNSGTVGNYYYQSTYYQVYINGVMTRPLADAYIFDCTKYGVPQAANISMTNLGRIKGHSAVVVWYQPSGYRDRITCN